MPQSRILLPESDLKVIARYVAKYVADSMDEPIELGEIRKLLNKPSNHATKLWVQRNLPHLTPCKKGDYWFYSKKELHEALLGRTSF